MKGLFIVSMCSSDSSQRNHSYRQTDQYQVLHNSLNFVNQELSFSLLFCSVFTAIYVEDMHNYLHFRFCIYMYSLLLKTKMNTNSHWFLF